MKKRILLTIAALLLISFLGIGTYMWYNFFLGITSNYGNSSNGSSSGSIKLEDAETSVTDSNASKVDDSEVSNVTPYTFKVKNSKNTEGKYTIFIEDAPLNSINDGCTEETLLSRKDLKYQLKLNGKIIKEDFLSSIKDNILDTETIKENTTNNYELRIYIHENANDWVGKHYHYQINIKEEK